MPAHAILIGVIAGPTEGHDAANLFSECFKKHMAVTRAATTDGYYWKPSLREKTKLYSLERHPLCITSVPAFKYDPLEAMAISLIPAPARPPGEATLRMSPAPTSKQTLGLLASLNPLHHIPVVSAVYDNLTGTRAVPAISIMVGAALAGPVGFIAALANALLEESTGNTLAGHAVAALMGESTIAEADSSGLGSPVIHTAAAVEDGVAASAIFDQREKLQFNRNGPDIQTAREVARSYLLELALRHPVRPIQSGAESTAG